MAWAFDPAFFCPGRDAIEANVRLLGYGFGQAIMGANALGLRFDAEKPTGRPLPARTLGAGRRARDPVLRSGVTAGRCSYNVRRKSTVASAIVTTVKPVSTARSTPMAASPVFFRTSALKPCTA